ncbi:epoxide hydrolase 1-like [Ciona intestinalis]
MLLYVVAFFVAVFAFLKLKTKKKEDYQLLSRFFPDKNWSENENEPVDLTITPFNIDIPQERIDDLNKRLDSVRMPTPSISTSCFRYGMRTEYMGELIKYWRNDYSWKEQEEKINQFNHFKTRIEGLDIHFIHAKPKAGVEAKTVLMTHGWPGSFVEFLEIIPMLTDPVSYGGNENDAMNVVCPSIPGFGFSDPPAQEGFNTFECARVFHKLMLRLGYKKYYVQGGDYGSIISIAVALLYPSYVKGCHTTMMSARPEGTGILRAICAAYFPRLLFNDQEKETILPFKKYFTYLFTETGYFHLHATKPDTVGFGLSDSPAGLAAYIAEKFSTWTNKAARDTKDGMLDKYWTKDKLLNNIMIYWWSGNITSTMRLYKETFGGTIMFEMTPIKVRVPGGFCWFPNEIIGACKTWVGHKFPNLIHFTYMKQGGHFSAYEVPEDLSVDIRAFVRKVENRDREMAANETVDVKFSHLDRFDN